METIERVAAAMQTVLGATAEAAARATAAVKRRGKLGGAHWVQTLVFGWLANPAASLGEVSQTAARLGVAISPQGLEQRFTPEAAACLESVLAATLTEVVTTDPVAVPVLRRFPAVSVQDTTTLALPAALAGAWRGGDGDPAGGGRAAVKAQKRRCDLTCAKGRCRDRCWRMGARPTSAWQRPPQTCPAARCCSRIWAIVRSPHWRRRMGSVDSG